MNKEEVLIITFKSIQDVLDLESKTKNGRMIPVPSCVKAGCGMMKFLRYHGEYTTKYFHLLEREMQRPGAGIAEELVAADLSA